MRRLALLALLTVACGATAAHAQALALAYHAGDVHKYAFHATSSEQISAAGMTIPVTVEMTATETATVKSVDSSGVADVTVELGGIIIKEQANGVTNATSGMTLPPEEIKIAADGRILSISGMASSGAFPFGMGMGIGMGGTLVSAVLPDTAVKPGDTWSKDYDQANPLGTGNIHVTTKSKYLRDESFQGVSAAVVETASDAAVDFTIDTSSGGTTTSPGLPLPAGALGGMQGITIKGTTTSDVTTWIDPGSHRILKSHVTSSTTGNMSFVLTPDSAMAGMIGPMSIKGTSTVDLTPA